MHYLDFCEYGTFIGWRYKSIFLHTSQLRYEILYTAAILKQKEIKRKLGVDLVKDLKYATITSYS